MRTVTRNADPAKIIGGYLMSAQRSGALTSSDEVIATLEAAGYVIARRRDVFTDEGQKLGDVLAALYDAVPNSAVRTQRLADALKPACAFVYQPRFRVVLEAAPGARLTDCETGACVYFQPGDDADTFREEFGPWVRDDVPDTAEGQALASMMNPTAEEYFSG
ncbi:hypothetical protein HOT99_gp081 [Caulobacter phage CcrBL10]|uniref:Uncharacterized protein n=1 Tax=Caulobacter phage CcrBL10 TaxID=2283269 RepID=A0A385EBV7_9CAUD|nr:hypothetical protein HOT99_gp014 [Caulobacter phage CcrBL10]YP_009809166.1 hypothetical protein HOT99_gp081 [Caulobacter phage CcrBL10]AXQ68218.1 hypothetical protein CcrBL10_gp014 [Caulobacter phage CcrBL10]AXQ68536.1 hypothetical protein CcrBL10_gp332 [Caulobacter phage CcrBL10]